MQSFSCIIFIILIVSTTVIASNGDRSQFFHNCLRSCSDHNCTKDGKEYIRDNDQPQINRLLFWSCRDECKYACMWRTTNAFLGRDWPIPQFYGKWPFVRFLGVQEPASVIFSLLNFGTHIKMIREFRRNVRNDSPMYYVWHIFCGICLNGWIWSMIFHTRDYPLTELLDYSGAYSIVLTTLACTMIRMTYKRSIFIKSSIVFIAFTYFLNYFMYLSQGHFDYAYNMKANIITGILSGLCWLLWYLTCEKEQNYAKNIIAFYLCTGASMILEINDFPPWIWIFDAHALWHLSTVPITVIFYRFITADCKYLRKKLYESMDDTEKEKLI